MDDMPDASQLTELRVNLLGKLFAVSMAAWLVGKATNLKLRGEAHEINAITEAMTATKQFQDQLHDPAATVESVMNALNLKHEAVAKFEAILGIPFPI